MSSLFIFVEAVAFQNSILETCELYRNQPGEDVANFFVEGRFYCFMEAFRDYTIAQGDTFPVTTNVVDKLCKWKNEYEYAQNSTLCYPSLLFNLHTLTP